MDVFLKVYLPRVFMGVAFAAIVWWTARINNNGSFPVYYYIIVIGVFLVQQVGITLLLLLKTVTNFSEF